MCIHKPLSVKDFHGVLAGNAHECLLKLSIGKVQIPPDLVVKSQPIDIAEVIF
jgi:hypothetical protein